MEKPQKKYYLGLDIGIGSVGWGIIGESKWRTLTRRLWSSFIPSPGRKQKQKKDY